MCIRDSHYSIPQFVLPSIAVAGSEHLAAVNAGQVGDDRMGSGADEQHIRGYLLHQFLCDGGIQMDRDPRFLKSVFLRLDILVKAIFEIHMLGKLQRAAQRVGGLIQLHLMTALLGSQCGLHPGGAAAHDHHLLGGGGLGACNPVVIFIADYRVQCRCV